MDTNKKRCFIITPIGSETDSIRRHIEGIIDAVIVPALGEKYEIVVAHRISEPGLITKQVINEVYEAALVIANLTGRNPNVMYELAFRHSLGRPAISIAEKGTQLPSDIVMDRTIFYENDAKGVLELREKLIAAEQEIDFAKKCGPIYDMLSQIGVENQVIDGLKSNNQGKETSAFELIISKLDKMEHEIKAIKQDTASHGLAFSSFDIGPSLRSPLDDDLSLMGTSVESPLARYGINDNVGIVLKKERNT